MKAEPLLLLLGETRNSTSGRSHHGGILATGECRRWAENNKVGTQIRKEDRKSVWGRGRALLGEEPGRSDRNRISACPENQSL